VSEAELLTVTDLVKRFPLPRRGTHRGEVTIVDSVSFSVAEGESWGLVGESGSGKSTTARLVLRLLDAQEGSIRFRGRELTGLRGKELRRVRADIQAVFQDVTGSLDPKMTIAQLLAEALMVHGVCPPGQRRARSAELMELVGLRASQLDRYPYELSGGQRQRVALARALSTDPALLVLDEAVSALDVSTRAQVINLLQDVQDRTGVAYLFIAHDLSVVYHLCDRIAVMYAGQIVEAGTAEQVCSAPRHPYTEALLSAIPERPVPGVPPRPRIVLAGGAPSPADPPPGCRFHPRCPHAMAMCAVEAPPIRRFGDGGEVACHLHDHGPTLEGRSVVTLSVPGGSRRPATVPDVVDGNSSGH
jgi:oligopeptide transport system ATP-binding protein